VFILIGLSLPEITAGLEGVRISTAIGYGVMITTVLIIGRILAAYGAVIVTLIARNFITVADTSNPGIKGPLILGWSGMRGVVSLAAALSIPVQLSDGTPFPQRNLILFITFIVIFLTLTLQGLTLPILIRKLNVQSPPQTLSDDEIDVKLNQHLSKIALDELNENYKEHLEASPILQQLAAKWQAGIDRNEIDMSTDIKEIYNMILQKQRDFLIKKNQEHELLNEEIIRKQLHRIDMEEERLRLL
jgi:CPA1 family monovalent cation:H+ antiporter